MTAVWRVGTRRSPLSLKQTDLACRFLQTRLSVDTEVIPITTSGDRLLHQSLAEIGGKGLFTKEIDRALQEERIDIAVHSAKDIETQMPSALAIAAFLPRGERRDCLITREQTPVQGLKALPSQTRLGTCSPRRTALVHRVRPDLPILPLRGNIERRLDKLYNGEVDAIILARCALLRLEREVESTLLDEQDFLPSAGQGAIALVVRAEDTERRSVLGTCSDRGCEREVRAERAFLRVLDGSCRTPLAASAHVLEDSERMLLRGFAAPGQPTAEQPAATCLWVQREGDSERAEQLGEALAREIAPLPLRR